MRIIRHSAQSQAVATTKGALTTSSKHIPIAYSPNRCVNLWSTTHRPISDGIHQTCTVKHMELSSQTSAVENIQWIMAAATLHSMHSRIGYSDPISFSSGQNPRYTDRMKEDAMFQICTCNKMCAGRLFSARTEGNCEMSHNYTADIGNLEQGSRSRALTREGIESIRGTSL